MFGLVSFGMTMDDGKQDVNLIRRLFMYISTYYIHNNVPKKVNMIN